jgi:hypothetical protein
MSNRRLSYPHGAFDQRSKSERGTKSRSGTRRVLFVAYPATGLPVKSNDAQPLAGPCPALFP